VVTASEPDHSLRRIRLRYPGTCRDCGVALSRGTEAWHDSASRKVVCLACGPIEPSAPNDLPGHSADAEAARRVERLVAKVRKEDGDLPAEVARQLAERDADASWGKGADGERRLAAWIEREVGDRVIALHDRRIPGSRANIDHIWIAAAGVWVVDAKAYAGKLECREVGPIWRRDHEVFVAKRNRSSLAKGVERQVEAVIAALRPDPTLHGTHVHGALCFLESEWGLLDFPFTVGRTWVMYPGALRRRLRKAGPLGRETMERIAHRLDLSLPHA
jgi:hypothetical protein